MVSVASLLQEMCKSTRFFNLVTILICAGLISCVGTVPKTGTWRQVMQLQKINKIRLHSESTGSGDPILLIHGFGGSIYSWREFIPILSKSNKVITVDLKGFGHSPKPADMQYSVYDQAALIINIIQENDLKNLTIVGHSYGGAVVLAVALNLLDLNPNRLSKIILIDSVAYAQPKPGFIKTLRSPILSPIVFFLLSNKQLVKHVLKLAYYNNDKIPNEAVNIYSKAINSHEAKNALVQVARNLVPSDVEDLCSSYKNIRIPTLILWGREDKIVPLWVGKRLASEIPGSRLVIIEQCGHMPHEEKPEDAIIIITRFLLGEAWEKKGGNINGFRIR